jgi:hypothetical protein
MLMGRAWQLQNRFSLHHARYPFEWLEALSLSDELFARLEALLQMESSLLAEVKAVAGGKSARELREALRIGSDLPAAPIEDAGSGDTAIRYQRQRALLEQRYSDERGLLWQRVRELAQQGGLPLGAREDLELYQQLQEGAVRAGAGDDIESGTVHVSAGEMDVHMQASSGTDARFAVTMGADLARELPGRLEASLELSFAFGEASADGEAALLRLTPEALRSRQVPQSLCPPAKPGERKVLVRLSLAEVTNGSGSRRYELCVGAVQGIGPDMIAKHPPLLPPEGAGGHLPRLALGGAIYQRERWEARAELFEGLTGLGLFLEVRRQVQGCRWPRSIFVRSGDGVRGAGSLLLDTRCPLAVELFGQLIGDARWLMFEEMYPAPEQLWLRDRRGRYVSALGVELLGDER